MFYSNQESIYQDEYKNFLTIVGSLSNLFSDSDIPFLNYRVAEKIFCKAFRAEDLSRSDVSIDAKKDSLGIGLKTFLKGNNDTFQKIAEFNSTHNTYQGLTSNELVTRISELRNDRIIFAEKLHGIEKSIYHCVVRDSGKFKIFEENMDKISIENIKNIKENRKSIYFDDGVNEYSFLFSKSTLTKRFNTNNFISEFEVDILSDPFKILENCFTLSNIEIPALSTETDEKTIFLPLYGHNKKVYEKSGLNQWNANGRPRDVNEVYIPVPRDIHKLCPHFFPDQDTDFILIFPDGERVDAKICQAGGKALMTKSNRKLGKLLLRDGLKLKEGELATYEKLQFLGIDSVRIDKLNSITFEINLAKTNSYENFINQVNT